MTRDEAVVTAINASAAHQFVLSKKDFYASLAASGYAVVPVEATEEMIEAGRFPSEWFYGPKAVWNAMLAAAQKELG